MDESKDQSSSQVTGRAPLVCIPPGYVRLMDVEKINFRKLYRDIQLHVDVGLKLYKAQRTENDATFYEIFVKFKEYLDEAQKHQEHLSARISKYDFVDANGVAVKANGYRNILYLMSCVLQPVHQSLQKAAKDRTRFRFPANEHINALSLHCSALHSVERIAFYSCKLMEATAAPQLFNDTTVSNLIKRKSVTEHLPRDIFYGRLLGFQYAPTMRPVLKMLGVGLASYEEWYRADKDEPVKQLLTSLWKGSRYLQSPSRLGLKMDYLTVETSVHFVKAFWSLSEQSAFQGAIKLTYQSVEICQWMEVPAMAFKVLTSDGELEMEPPSVHVGYKPIPLLLISHKWRGSQPYSHATKKKSVPSSPGLVVHFHGGGYVAQGPLSHSSYLRQWAFDLDAPIVSVDYSLSPEAPYPRALEESIFAYSWILQNLETIGSTGEKILFVGDSAGGNFCITTCMKLKQLGIRLPDAVLAIYPSTNITCAISPSRIMSIVDPILPLGVLVACQQAYSNQLPTPEQLSLRREYRARIMRSQGYYLQDPSSKPSSAKTKRKHSWKKTKSSASSSGKGDSEMGSVLKSPPPRPPPPPGSICKVDLEAMSSTSQQQQSLVTLESQVESNDSMLQNVSLGVDSTEASAVGGSEEEVVGASGMDGCETEDSFGVLSGKDLWHKREPDEKDKLSPAELEELLAEVMMSFESGASTQDPFMSPLFASDELLVGLPPIHIVGAALDSVLDDSVSMAQRLKLANQPVTLNVVDNLPHGFLSLVTTGNNTDHNNAMKLCTDYLKEEMDIPTSHKLKK